MEDRGWFRDDSSTLHLLCTLFLLLLHQLQLRSSGIRSWMLGTPALTHSCEKRILSVIFHSTLVCWACSLWETPWGREPGAWRETTSWERPGLATATTTANEGQDPGTGLGSLPSSSHHDPVCHGLVTSSHSPGGETEAWKGGVAPQFASWVYIRAQWWRPHTGRGSTRQGSRRDPRAQSCRQGGMGVVAKAACGLCPGRSCHLPAQNVVVGKTAPGGGLDQKTLTCSPFQKQSSSSPCNNKSAESKEPSE